MREISNWTFGENKPKQSQFQRPFGSKWAKIEGRLAVKLVKVPGVKSHRPLRLKPRRRLLGCGPKLASQGGTNLWQNRLTPTIKSSLEFRTVPIVTVGRDMCLGGFRWLYQAGRKRLSFCY